MKAVRRLEEKLDMPRRNFTTLRKSHVTDGPGQGVSSDIVAELCGNSVKTIENHPSLLESERDALREAARKIAT